MAQTKHQIQEILDRALAAPRHRFGQNFMIDANLVRLVASSAEISPDDQIIEVGPGTGTLTEELIGTGARVLAVEIDKTLAGLLRSRFENSQAFSLLVGDALEGKHALNPQLLSHIRDCKSRPQTVKLVANLPYNIASPLIIELLIAGVNLLAFTVQKEVAERLRAAPGSGDYGTLSVMVQMLAGVEVLRTIPRQAFWPMPKIESALVRLRKQDRLGKRAPEFGQFVRQIFSARRKTLRNALILASRQPDPIFARLDLDPAMRPEELSPEQYVELFTYG